MATVRLYRPDGGVSIEIDEAEVLSYNKDIIEFRVRVEGDKAVTFKDYTSNLKYLILEETTGSKEILL